MSTTKTKLTRQRIKDLNNALTLCRTLDVPSKFRYAISKNMTGLESELKAMQEGWPEPDLAPYQKDANAALQANGKSDKLMKEADEKHKELIDSWNKWQEDTKKPFSEMVDVPIYKTEVIEINDESVKPEFRNQRNQVIIEALMPIFKD